MCQLCGQWVDIQDLVQCEVQGLRGFWVCSSHSWEKDIRFKPSWLDRGGVSNVADPSGGLLPGPGGFFIDPEEDELDAILKTSNQTVTGSTLTADTALTIGVLAGKSYWYRVLVNPDLNASTSLLVAMGGTATATRFLLSTPGFNNAVVTSLGTEFSCSGSSGTVVELAGSITVLAAGSFGLYFARAIGGSIVNQAGAYMMIGRMN